MVIPLPTGMIPQQMGGPTNYCQKMRPWFLVVLILQIAICAFRLFGMLDIWGGFIMGIGIGLGVYAYKQDMDIQFVCYYGLFNLINGVLDTVRTLDQVVKSPFPLFSTQAGFGYNMMGVIVVGIPLSALIGAFLSYQLYSDYKSSPQSGGYEAYYPSGGGGAWGGQRYGSAGSRSESGSGGAGGPTQQSFTAFAGSGQRLGSA